MNVLQKLAELANTLDKMGQTEAADQIDDMLKDAGFGDWLKQKIMPAAPAACTCDCESCQAGQARGGPHALEYHNQCTSGKCPIKAQQKV